MNTKLRSVTRCASAPGGAPSAARNRRTSLRSKLSDTSSTSTIALARAAARDRVDHRAEARRLVPVAAKVRERRARVGQPRDRRDDGAAHVAHPADRDVQRAVRREHRARAVGPLLPARAEQPLRLVDAQLAARDEAVARDGDVGSARGFEHREQRPRVRRPPEALDEGVVAEHLAVRRVGGIAHAGRQPVEVGLGLQLERQVQLHRAAGGAGLVQPLEGAERHGDARRGRSGRVLARR